MNQAQFQEHLQQRNDSMLTLVWPEVTGPISIRQEAIPGKTRGARWIATFSPDLLALLRHVTQGRDCPDSVTLEFRSG